MVVAAACGDSRDTRDTPLPVGPASSLDAALAQQGSVRVIVGVKTPFVVEGKLDDVGRANQRGRIASAQLGARARFTGHAVQHVHSFGMSPFMVVRVDDQAALDMLRADPDVVSLKEDRVAELNLDSSTPVIAAPQAWTAGFTGAGQAVAIIDSGVMNTHTHFTGKIISEACFSTTDPGSNSTSLCAGGVDSSTAPTSGTNCPLTVDGCFHGTHVANIAAGANATYNGVAKGADIVAIMAGSSFSTGCNSGPPPCVKFFTSDQIRALERVLALKQGGTQIAAVNMSLGGGQYFDQASCDLDDVAEKAAIDNLRSAGVVTVISSGNSGFTDSLGSPGCISTALSVGATVDADTVVGFSNSSSFLGVLAPGVNVTAAVPNTTTSVAALDGTSMAAPHVAGAVAVLRSAFPALSVDDVIETLKATGQPIFDARNGITKPRINVFAAIQYIQNAVAPITFSPPGGTFGTPQSVTLSTTTAGAQIFFTTDGSEPTQASTPYTGVIAIPATSVVTIKARGFKTGGMPSTIATATYDVAGQIATPIISPAGQTTPFPVSVQITAPTPLTTIHVTTDGSTPTAASPVYTAEIVVPNLTTRTIKAIATHPGWTDSAVASATYVVTDTVEIPSFSLPAGTYTSAQSLAIVTGTIGAQLRFTTDGSPATSTSPLYTGPIALAAGTTTTVRARAFLATWGDSQEATATYTITGTVATPTATPPGGTFSSPQSVALAVTTPGATIRFTTDGSPATATSPVYATPIAVGAASTVRVRARAFLATWGDSAELDETYDVTGVVATPVLSPAGGTFTSPQSVTITTATIGATIRFTTDGSAPTGTSTAYSGAIPVAAEATVTIRAKGFKAQWTDSAEAGGTYTVTCTRAAPSVTIAPATQTGAPLALKSYTATITNNNNGGCLPATFAISRSGPSGWTTALDASSATLASGASTTVALDVTSAAAAVAGDYPVSVTASNVDSGMTTGNATYSVTCTRLPPTLALAPATQSGQAGNPLDYTATITNHDVGCAASTFTLASTVDAGWTGVYSAATPSVASGASATSTLTVTSAAGSSLGDHAIGAAVTRTESAGATAAATYTVAPTCARAAPTLTLAPSTQTALRGATVQYTATLTNNDAACGPGTFTIALTLPSGFTGSNTTITAGSNSTNTATIDVTSPVTANAGNYTITVGASNAASGAATATATYVVETTCVRQPPVISVTQPAAQTAAVAAHYAVHVTNNDHVDCGPSLFAVSGALPAGWTVPAVPHSLAPAASQDFDLVVTPPASLGASSTTFDITATNLEAPNFTALANGVYVLGCEHAVPTLAVTTVTENERYAIKVSNHDTAVCAASTFRVKLASQIGINPSQADLAAGPGMDGAFEVDVTPPETGGEFEVKVTVTRFGESAVVAEHTITINVAAPPKDDDGCQAAPSPATGMLLLFGIAFVLRRRRARG